MTLLIVVPLLAGETGLATPALSQAIALYEARRYSAAREMFTRIAAQRGPDVETDYHLGRLAAWFDDGPAALLHLERAARKVPNEARVHNALGDAHGLAAQTAGLLAKLGCAKRCLAAYARAVELEPENPRWRWSLLGFYLLAPRLAGGGTDKAYAEAEQIRRLDPMAGRVAFATLYLAEKRWAAAFAEFEPVLEQTPDDFLALYHVGRCAAVSGEQLDRGIAALRRCLSLAAPEGDGMPTRASVYHRLGDLLEKKGRHREAQSAYARALTENPDFRPEKMALKN